MKEKLQNIAPLSGEVSSARHPLNISFQLGTSADFRAAQLSPPVVSLPTASLSVSSSVVSSPVAQSTREPTRAEPIFTVVDRPAEASAREQRAQTPATINDIRNLLVLTGSVPTNILSAVVDDFIGGRRKARAA